MFAGNVKMVITPVLCFLFLFYTVKSVGQRTNSEFAMGGKPMTFPYWSDALTTELLMEG